jgi:hypothetical protein
MGAWGTPTAQDAKHSTVSASKMDRDPNNLRIQVHTAPWPTTQSRDGSHGAQAKRAMGETRHGRSNLDDFAKLTEAASWATPTSRDHKDGACQGPLNMGTVEVNALLGRQATLATPGPTSSGSPAATARRGQLNPDFSRWLMGYGTEHLSCAPTATPSSLRSRRNSSKPSWK